jgi:leader peptidase (prepilin peptidase)/N-methyltransferase
LRLAATLVAAGLGAIWGSFLNVCIARIPRGMSVVRPASHCFACGAHVSARDNIPILSYFLLRGRCRSCGAKFSSRHALVEAVAAALAALVFWTFVVDAPGEPLGVRAARCATYFAFAAVLVVLSFIDLDTKRLPDIITLPSIAVFFLAGFAVHEVPWSERALGAAAGYLLVRLVGDGYYYATGREGLGLGDGKLLAIMGALFGWKSIPAIVLLASLTGILVSVPVLVLRRRQAAVTGPTAPLATAVESLPPPAGASGPTAAPPAPGASRAPSPPTSIRRAEVPFGPFLAASALAYLFLGKLAWAALMRTLTGE